MLVKKTNEGIVMKVLVTGGAGYIGSTICTAIEKNGDTPVILDSLVGGQRSFVRSFPFYENDIAEPGIIEKIKSEHPEIETIIHCAARIIVPESVENPHLYYTENVSKSMALFESAAKVGIKNIVFSSSASVYGNVEGYVATESSPTNPESPYARTKLMMEMVLADYAKAYGLKAVSLRYFNPIGTDPDHTTGPYVKNPSHILGRLVSAAKGEIGSFTICGTDYPTRDGTGVRDYIHVWDIAWAHIKAISYLNTLPSHTHDIINLGTGNGTTVREFVRAFEESFNQKLATKDVEPRPGDVAGVYASCEKAKKLLTWNADLQISQAIKDALIWEKVL